MRVLIVGCGPGGENWREHPHDVLIACNSAIMDCAADADVFLVMENLGQQGDVKFPWIHTETSARKLIDSKNLQPGRLKKPMVGNLYHMPRNSTRPMCYPETRVGTVLADALELCLAMGADEVHTIGFPLYGLNHWTDDYVYTEGSSQYMRPECFVDVNEYHTLWQWALSAAWVKSQDYPFTWIDHSNGLLQIPGIKKMVKHIDDMPRDLVV